MSSTAWILVAVAAALIVAGLVAWWLVREQRSRRLRQTFGPEYDRTIADAPTRREAEEDLADRRRRREELDIRPLPAAARDRYLFEWRGVQERFVEDPESAIGDADDLIQQVMRERGYPVEDFDQRAADLSVDHADVVEDYRAAHAIALAHAKRDATTEDLRTALLRYRSLFESLLDTRETADAR
jgi:ABC-type nickel/cobalt efflux system permease component RcnA